jgi:hypothetical protein
MVESSALIRSSPARDAVSQARRAEFHSYRGWQGERNYWSREPGLRIPRRRKMYQILATEGSLPSKTSPHPED